jgi:FkbM family methyltransferase
MLLNLNSLIKQYNVQITGVIHVGGHIGEEMRSYKNSNVENLIVFEPQKHCFDQLCEEANQVGLTNARLINKALGNEVGRVEMTSDPTGLCGSILNPKLHLELSPDVIFSVKEEVDLSTLDNEIEEDHSFNFLNMDTQGYELEVLKGGKRTLEKIQYIYTEVNQAEVYENNAMIHELDEFLESYDMERIATGWHGSQTWGDAFYIKRGLI